MGLALGLALSKSLDGQDLQLCALLLALPWTSVESASSTSSGNFQKRSALGKTGMACKSQSCIRSARGLLTPNCDSEGVSPHIQCCRLPLQVPRTVLNVYVSWSFLRHISSPTSLFGTSALIT